MESSKRLKEFVCWECGNCCRGEGFVAITPEDIERMAEYPGCSELEFTRKFTKQEKNRRGLVLKEKGDDAACIFLNGDNTCAVYQARPEQCAGFPYTWNYANWWLRCENKCALQDKPITIERMIRRKEGGKSSVS